MRILFIWWNKLSRTVKILVEVLSILAVLVTLWQTIPQTPHDKIDLVGTGVAELTLDTDSVTNPDYSRVIVAKKILVKGGAIKLSSEAVLIANEVIFDEGSEIQSRNLTLIATRVIGGVINAKGSDGSNFGENGSEGGNVFLSIATSKGLIIDVSGGDGANGAIGSAGQDGRNGKCSGFGGWRSAHEGINGSHGGPGGNGGDGGTVTVFASIQKPVVKTTGGKPGTGGAGGNGGRGGRGCTGLGGSQSTARSGFPGAHGVAGTSGTEGRYFSESIKIEMVKNIVEDWLADSSSTAKDLQKKLGSL